MRDINSCLLLLMSNNPITLTLLELLNVYCLLFIHERKKNNLFLAQLVDHCWKPKKDFSISFFHLFVFHKSPKQSLPITFFSLPKHLVKSSWRHFGKIHESLLSFCALQKYMKFCMFLIQNCAFFFC